MSLANDGLRRRVDNAVRTVWAELPTLDAVATRDQLATVMPDVVAGFGDVAAVVAADRYEQVLADAGVRVQPALLADSVPVEAVQAGVRWAVGPLFGADGDTLSALDRMVVVAERLALSQSDETMRVNAQRDHVRYAWVPAGPTCAFCTMLASRGAVYHSRESGSSSRHSHCDCAIEPVASQDDLDRLASQNGYEPAKLYSTYSDAADVTSGRTRSVLAEMRRQNPQMQ